jgi:CRISPR-associated protein Cmr1
MKQLEYTLHFNTPAFLGNAEQNGQWRTPPIKAQLRQWWRVAYAADHSFRVDVAAMRRDEGKLFGVASDGEGDSRKSLVRIRLDKWDEGQLKNNQWPGFAPVSHPEVPRPVASDLYLGYGPVTLRGGAPTLKANAAIPVGDSAPVSSAAPDEHAPRLERALWLMDRYGTLGGRSRNGWGSFALLPLPQAGEGWCEGGLPLRHWQDCLQLDWPHAIGQDEKGALIWQTAPHDDWKALMKTLAMLKIGLRTQFVFPNTAPPHSQPLPRHWLSYPITRHATKTFDRNARLPNQLRFKVRPTPEGKLVGAIFHVPHLPPPGFHPNRETIIATWQTVHALLDELVRPAARSYACITDSNRRVQLKPQLDAIEALRRIGE